MASSARFLQSKIADNSVQDELQLVLAVLDTMAGLVVVLDSEGHILRFNRACELLTGYLADEIRGKCVWDLLLIPEETTKVRRVFQGLRAGDFPSQAENYWLDKAGGRHLTAWSNTAILDDTGAVKYVVGTGVDITDRRAVELALGHARNQLEQLVQRRTGELQEANEFLRAQNAQREQADAELRRSQERFRAAAESANDLIYELDTQTGKLEWFGDVDAKMGYPAGGFPRTVSGYLNAIHPEDNDRVMAAIEEHLRRGTRYDIEYRVRCLDGEYRFWRDRGTAFWDEQGSPYKLVGATTDITEHVLAYQNLEESVAERTHELATLLAVSHTVSSTLELQPLLSLILAQLRKVVDYVGAAVMRLEGGVLVVQAYRGVIDQDKVLNLHFPLEGELASRDVILGRQPVIIPDVRADTPQAEAFRQSVAARPDVPFGYIMSWMGVPLIVKDRVIGMLSFDHTEANFYSERDAELALAFANEAAMAIENARLYEQAQELAAVEERQRLARDLHDSVTQSLYGVTLYAEAASRLMAAGDIERATEYLNTLGETAREALREMRLLIFELRPPLLEQEGLVAAMHARLDAVEGRAGLQVQFSAAGDLNLPFDMQKELYRIGQEALNNVLKHARAKAVSVQLAGEPGLVRLDVRDDGVGFDTSLRGHGLGLPGMAERVEILKGKYEITSSPGKGTHVCITIPTGGEGEEL